MEVHSTLGCGFLEIVYRDALEREFIDRKIPYQREVEIRVPYKGIVLPSTYRADFICFGSVIVEAKAIKGLTEIDEAQALNYVRATRFTRAILVNFGGLRLEYKRMVYGHNLPPSSV